MIRFVHLGNQIALDDEKPERRFAFWDTRTDRFIALGGSQAFASVDDLRASWECGGQIEDIDRLVTMAEVGLAEARGAYDNLAATVELCCLPVDGEVSLCDRVRAAGEAQRRADERLAEARADLRSALCLVVLAAQAANRCGLTFGGLSLSDHEEYGRLKRLVGLAADLKGEP